MLQVKWHLYPAEEKQYSSLHVNGLNPFKLTVKNISAEKSLDINGFFTFAPLLESCHQNIGHTMYWTLELASYLEDAPWPATKDELIDYSIRSGAPLEVVENLQELEDDGQPYESIEEIWPDYPTKDDFFFNEDEY
ncbi:Protein of unknown function [Spirosoma fluviale]|nr:Protein of unknown function [Spirosoma fluviale]